MEKESNRPQQDLATLDNDRLKSVYWELAQARFCSLTQTVDHVKEQNVSAPCSTPRFQDSH